MYLFNIVFRTSYNNPFVLIFIIFIINNILVYKSNLVWPLLTLFAENNHPETTLNTLATA